MYIKCIKSIKNFTEGKLYKLYNKIGNKYQLINDKGDCVFISIEYFKGISRKNQV